MNVTPSHIPPEYPAGMARFPAICRNVYRLNTEEKEKGSNRRMRARLQRTGNVLLGSLSSHRILTAIMTSISTPPQKLLWISPIPYFPSSTILFSLSICCPERAFLLKREAKSKSADPS